MKHYITFLKSIFFFISIFIILHIIHLNFFSYSHIISVSIFDIFLSASIVFILLLIYSYKNHFIHTVSLIVFILFSSLYTLTVPIMIDRSITVDMFLALYASDNNTLNKNELVNKVFDKSIMDKRIEEQIQSGIILVNSSDEISLTSKGLIISSIYYHVNSLFQIKDIKK